MYCDGRHHDLLRVAINPFHACSRGLRRSWKGCTSVLVAVSSIRRRWVADMILLYKADPLPPPRPSFDLSRVYEHGNRRAHAAQQQRRACQPNGSLDCSKPDTLCSSRLLDPTPSDMKDHPNCRYSMSSQKECTSTNGDYACETIRRVFRNCPGLRPTQVYDVTTRDTGTVPKAPGGDGSDGGSGGMPVPGVRSPQRVSCRVDG